MSDYNLTPGWEDEPIDSPYTNILDEWFRSDIYKTVVNQAVLGDSDSMELLDQVDSHLDAATFHINNGSDRKRVDYEVEQMANIIRPFLEK
jgi:hypothetical protein